MPETTILGRLLNAYLFIFSFGFGNTVDAALALLQQLATLEIIVMGLWWTMTGDSITAVGMGKILTFGILVWLITEWPMFSQMVQESFIKWGLQAGGNVLTVADFRNPGNIFSFGAEVSTLMITQLKAFSSWTAVLVNIVEIGVTGVLALLILAAFGWLTIQIAVAMLEFYLASVMMILLLPFGAFHRFAPLAEKAMGYILAHGVKLATLAVIVSAAQPAFVHLKPNGATAMGYDQMFALALGVGFLITLSFKGPALANGIMSGVAVLSASSVAQTAVSAGIGLGAAALGGLNTMGAGIRGVQGAYAGGRASLQAANQAIGHIQENQWRQLGGMALHGSQRLAAQTLAHFNPPQRRNLSGYTMMYMMPRD